MPQSDVQCHVIQHMCICGLSAHTPEGNMKDLLINPLNAELNAICHLLALLGAHHILHVSRIRVKQTLALM